MAQSNLQSFGYNEVITKSGNYTVVNADSGTIINVTATATITLPATGTGNVALAPIIRVGADGIVVTIAPAAADSITGAQLTAVANKALIFGLTAPVGSYVQLQSNGIATGTWSIVRLDAGGVSTAVTKAP
jgi:hypothetical protein